MSEPEHSQGPFAVDLAPQAARLRRALIDLVAERGFEGLGVEDVCARARLPRSAFEARFADLRECALAVYLADMADYDRAIAAAVDSAAPWRTRLRETAYATARYIAARPCATNFDVVAMLAVGEIAQAHRDRYVRRLVDLIDEGRREPGAPASLTPATAEGVFGAIYQLLSRELVGEARTAGAAELVPQLMYLAVRPYLGDGAAREELSTPPPPPRPEPPQA